MEKIKQLSLPQEMFLEYILQGYNHRTAYIKAFPKHAHYKPSSIDVKASILFNQTNVQLRYRELKQQLTDELQEKALWTKEESICELKELLRINKEESKRYQQAYEDEMQIYDRKINELEKQIKKPKKYLSKKKSEELQNEIEKLKMGRIRLVGRHQSNKTVNEAILQSILQLNEIMGYKKDDKGLNLNAHISFIDDVPEED